MIYVYIALLLMTVWIAIGLLTVCAILFYIWYNGYPIITSHMKEILVALVFGLWVFIQTMWRIIYTRDKFKLDVLWKSQDDDKIILHGRKSARVFRYLTEQD